ncbi:Hpt domain-containing protein [Vibrio alfacsensis]|uniref:Phosphorelay protein LuxU n=1 Tax=Vibrio alfacsensis TaxID=1074311 RepID=A0ABM6YUW4_9VIBR|nr:MULTISPECIES: quorum-sensing phosphorelay protein LuxU [Vibrio]AXY01490.1 Hpt domain-containing protein [Vibrio alfacsensis]CAE6950246.1 Phosphorelay protein which receives a sensory signal from a sensor kinase and transmit it to LuxO. At low cell density [Vibrio sp. B1REV9]
MNMDILNQSKIDQLSVDIGSDNVPVLLEIFLGELDTYVTNLSRFQAEEQDAYLREISHALKSSAASFGADQLCELANTIDIRVKSCEIMPQGPEVNEMLELLDRTREAYRAWTK